MRVRLRSPSNLVLVRYLGEPGAGEEGLSRAVPRASRADGEEPSEGGGATTLLGLSGELTGDLLKADKTGVF